MHSSPIARRGVTLIELVVALAILGLASTLVLPALRAPSPERTEMPVTIARARHEAIVRGQSLTLDIEPGGRWTLHVDADTSTRPIRSGVSNGVTARLRLNISPLGTCVPDTPAPTDWDAVACDTGSRGAGQ